MTTTTEPTILKSPRICILTTGDTIELRFQDPVTKADLCIVHLPRELARDLTDEFRALTPALPPGVVPRSAAFILDEEELA